jgi:hypothetical protein
MSSMLRSRVPRMPISLTCRKPIKPIKEPQTNYVNRMVMMNCKQITNERLKQAGFKSKVTVAAKSFVNSIVTSSPSTSREYTSNRLTDFTKLTLSTIYQEMTTPNISGKLAHDIENILKIVKQINRLFYTINRVSSHLHYPP